jgi:4-amino-4-deoxy-L-arabinose transferase-like glycosyltransferase
MAAALVAVVTALYATRLGSAPIYLMHDEVNFALQAHAIATTARDTNGRLLPVYFSETGFEAGRDPIVIYAMAAALWVWPLSEQAVRLPVAMLAVLNVWLMWLLARRLFASHAAGAMAALFLAFTPAHFINGRLALSILCPVSFVLLWLVAAERQLAHPSVARSVGAGLALGAGVYSYLAALLMMPAYLLLSLLTVWRRAPRPLTAALVMAFLVAMLPLAVWTWLHPARFRDLLEAYQVGPGVAAPAGVMDLIRDRAGVWWRFFDPDLWFIGGPGRVTNSTRLAGLFPLSFAVLLPVGVFATWRGGLGAIGPLMLAGCVLSPLATVVSGRLEVNRILFVLPFGAVLAAAGAVHLWRAGGGRRWLGAGLTAAVAIQFVAVYADYMGPYRHRSAPWFGDNLRGAVQAALTHQAEHGGVVWLSARSPIERYWRFYAIAAGHEDWASSPVYYDPAAFSDAQVGDAAILVCGVGDPACESLSRNADWTRVQRILEPDGRESFHVFVRRGQ